MVEAGVATLASETSGPACIGSAVVIVSGWALLTITAMLLVLRFHRRFCRTVWSEAERAGSWKDVNDPLMRLRSCFRGCFGAEAVRRDAGEFKMIDADSEEPARTERILSSPFTLLHQSPNDAFEAMGSAWLGRSTGDSLTGITYDFVCFLVMICLGVTCGLGELAERNGAGTIQAIVSIALTVGLSLYIFVLRPSIDRLENSQNCFQLFVEGLSTFLLLVPLFFPDAPHTITALAAFFGALLGVLVPIVLKMYDSVFVPLWQWRAGGGDCKSLMATVRQIMWSVPGLILDMLGMSSTLVDEAANQTKEGARFFTSKDGVVTSVDDGDELRDLDKANTVEAAISISDDDAKLTHMDAGVERVPPGDADTIGAASDVLRAATDTVAPLTKYALPEEWPPGYKYALPDEWPPGIYPDPDRGGELLLEPESVSFPRAQLSMLLDVTVTDDALGSPSCPDQEADYEHPDEHCHGEETHNSAKWDGGGVEETAVHGGPTSLDQSSEPDAYGAEAGQAETATCETTDVETPAPPPSTSVLVAPTSSASEAASAALGGTPDQEADDEHGEAKWDDAAWEDSGVELITVRLIDAASIYSRRGGGASAGPEVVGGS